MTDATRNDWPAPVDGHPWGIYLMFGLFGAQQGMLGPIMPFLRGELGLDLRWTGLHFAAYALGLALVGFPYRWLERRAFSIGMGSIAIASVVVASGLFSVAHYLPMTLLAAMLMGVSGGLVMAVGQAMLGARYQEQAAAKLVAAHVMAGLCVLGGALLVGGTTAVDWSWRVAPLMVAVCAVVLVMASRSAYRVDAGSSSHDVRPVQRKDSSPLGRRLQLCLWTLVILGISAEWGVGFWGAEYMKTHVQISASAAATLMSVYFAGTVCGRLASSYALRAIRPLTLLVAVMLGAIATLLVLYFTQERWATAAFTFVLGACLGNFFPLILGSAMSIAPRASSALSAQASQAVGVALLLAPFLLGLLSERIGVEAAFSLLIVYPILMLPVVLGLRGALSTGNAAVIRQE